MYIPALVWKMGHGWHGCFWADSKQWGFVIVDTVCELPITYKSWSVGVGTFYTAATNQTRATSINPTLNTVKLVANYNEGPANGYYLCVGK